MSAACHGRPKRILVAGENRIKQKVIAWMLSIPDCDVETTGNGLEALAAVTRSQFHGVLMGIQIPEMTGVVATKRIRVLGGAYARLPIIALIANTMQGDLKTYLAAVMNEFVAKSIDRWELLAAIGRCAGRSLDVGQTEVIAKPAAQPMNADAATDFDHLIAGIDDPMDGTP